MNLWASGTKRGEPYVPLKDLELWYQPGRRVGRAGGLLLRNPRLFTRKAVARTRLAFAPRATGTRIKKIGDVSFECDFSVGRTMNVIYRDAYQLDVVDNIQRLLPRGGVFADVGAHVGFLSAVALARVGRGGEVHSFEPVPKYFARLRRLVDLNPGYHIFIHDEALDHEEGELVMDVGGGGAAGGEGCSTAVPGLLSDRQSVERVTVRARRLDTYLLERRIRHVDLIKIDAEGFEVRVIEGMSRFFEDTRERPPIICEIFPRAFELLGGSLSEMDVRMRALGYRPTDPMVRGKAVVLGSLPHETASDVLFVADRGS